MKGDFTRSTFKPAKHYTSVRMQQGRVQLDADWNEQNDIEMHLDRTTRLDVIGPCGVPEDGGGFAVALTPDNSDLTLSTGRLYVDGILCELDASAVPIGAFLADNRVTVPIWSPDGRAFEKNQWVVVSADSVPDKVTKITDLDATQLTLSFQDNMPQFKAVPCRLRRIVTFTTQPYAPGAAALSPTNGHTDLVYLDVWERHLTVVEDPDLRETALGGPDTATRLQTVWQVVVMANVGNMDCKDKSHYPPPSDGRLTTDVVTPPDAQGPCIVPPSGGYRGLENQFYRVEIHDGGAPYVWPRPTGLTPTAVTDIKGKQVTVSNWTVAGRDWQVGQTVELFSSETDAKNQAGTLATITAVDTTSKTLTLDQDVSAIEGNTNRQLRRIATFKWSRDNGSIVFGVDGFAATDGKRITLKRLGRDHILGLRTNDWIEVLGDTSELNGAPGALAQVAPDGIDEDTLELTLTADVSAYKLQAHPKVRRWDTNADQMDAAIPVAPGPIPLEDGIQVYFSGNVFRTGDYWSFAARTATVDIEHLADEPAQGIAHHYCPLALVTWQPNGQANVHDCRAPFPSLTTICAEDVCFDNTKCQMPQVETVQDALEQLCEERDLRFHNKHLHGWGIVCGLEVACGPDDPDGKRAQVTVGKGYAIDCEGNDLLLDRDDTIRVLDQALKLELVKPHEDGDVCLTLGLDQEQQLKFGLEKFEPSKDTWQALLSGTLLMDFYNDCIKNIQEFLERELTPPKGEENLPAGPVTQRVSALTNLLAQVVNPQAGKNIFISPREDTLIHQFHDDLRKILSSETFCAMFDNARLFPDYPFKNLGMDTIFGKGQHTRLRLRPDGQEAYTVGPGLNPLQPSTTMNRYNLQKKLLVEVIDPVLGTDKSGGNSGAGSVQDVAFSTDSKVIYTIVSARHDENTIFRAGDIASDGSIKWRSPVTICGVKLVTLAVTPADKTNVYAVGVGKGLYQIDPNKVNPNMEPIASFNAVGHLVISADGRAFATGAAKSQAPIYDTVHAFRLPAATKLDNFPLELIEHGQDDIAIYTTADGAKTETLYVVIGTGNDTRSVMAFDLTTGHNLIGKPIAVDSTTIHLNPYAPTRMLLMACEDSYCVRMIDMTQNQLVEGYLLPMQVAPIAITSDPKTGTGYILNYVSNTITIVPGKLFDPQFRFDLKALATYRAGVLEAFADLLARFLQYLKDCLCDHFLVKCPQCEPDDKLYLACITIRKDQVYRVCNFSKRRYVKSFPTMEYWLSLVPIVPLLDRLIGEFCCIILPDLFSRFSVAPFEAAKPQEVVTRVRAAWLRDGVSMAQAADVIGSLRGFISRNRISASLLGESLFYPRLATEPKAVEMTNVVGQPADSVEEQLKSNNISVRRVAYTRTTPANLLLNLVGSYRTPEPGDVVTLFEKDGAVVYYSVASEDPAKEVRAQVMSLSRSLQLREGEWRQLRAQIDAQRATLAEVDTLKAKLADTEEQLAAQREASAQIDELKVALAETENHLNAQRAAIADVQTLRTRLAETQTLLAQKDQELAGLRGELSTVEKKQTEFESSVTPDKVAGMENELIELRTFREQVTKFMEGASRRGKRPKRES